MAESGKSDPTKDAFKAALDAKNAKHHGGESHADAGAPGKGDTHRAGAKREFRRKSG
jgi:hypothetical protein